MSDQKPSLAFSEIIDKASARAFRGGWTGAAAMGLQVGSLMWMRTAMNYQYRYGGTMVGTMKHLYAEGGIPRFYRGVLPALVQGPMSRFGDTAANAGMMTLMDNLESTRDLPIMLKTGSASVAAGLFRIFLMPVDTVKSIMQVEGSQGLTKLRAKVATTGPTVLYHGAIAASMAATAGHYPWFVVYNYLSEAMPEQEELFPRMARNGFIGLAASATSDVVSNSIRVVKTFKQTSEVAISYPEVVRNIIKTDGISGLFLRGLGTRVIAHGVNGIVFTVAWKELMGGK